LPKIATVAAGENHTVALASDGTVWTWGKNDFGQLGMAANFGINGAVQVRGPRGVGFLTDVIEIAAGANHNLAITKDGGVWAWGDNRFSQLGVAAPDGCSAFPGPTTPCSQSPVLVATVPGAQRVAGGERHSLLLVSVGP
jgi:hypothetical protein